MARNKHPEETVEKILTVSAKLFMEKGYEHTTLQDIIDDLGGLTKGAIYHHFKGKEEILLAIADRMGEQTARRSCGGCSGPPWGIRTRQTCSSWRPTC